MDMDYPRFLELVRRVTGQQDPGDVGLDELDLVDRVRVGGGV